MYEYGLAVYLWSTLGAVALLAPFVALAAREAASAIQHLRDHAAPPSLTSLPSIPSMPCPSRPSGW